MGPAGWYPSPCDSFVLPLLLYHSRSEIPFRGSDLDSPFLLLGFVLLESMRKEVDDVKRTAARDKG
jgi:hypothetical protein